MKHYSPENRAYRRGAPHAPFHIKLECGCTIKTRMPPRVPQSTFGCLSGLSHGYRLVWISWTNTDTGRTGRQIERN